MSADLTDLPASFDPWQAYIDLTADVARLRDEATYLSAALERKSGHLHLVVAQRDAVRSALAGLLAAVDRGTDEQRLDAIASVRAVLAEMDGFDGPHELELRR